MRLHGGGRGECDEQGDAGGDQAKDGGDGQLDRVSGNEDGVVFGQIGRVGALECREDAEENEEGGHAE